MICFYLSFSLSVARGLRDKSGESRGKGGEGDKRVVVFLGGHRAANDATDLKRVGP